MIALVIAAVVGGAGAAHGTLHLAGGAAPFGAGSADALSAVLAIAMGIQNSTARALAVPDLTTTVLTMTLTGIGADARSGRRGRVMLVRRVLVVVTMLAGGVAGAWLVLHAGAVIPLALVAFLLAVAVVVTALAVRRPGEWRHAGPAASVAASGPPGRAERNADVRATREPLGNGGPGRFPCGKGGRATGTMR